MSNIVCSICIENLMAEKSEVDNVITDCGHVYHDACLAQWLEKSPDCPDCNKLILVRRKVFFNTTDYDPQKECLRMFFKYLVSSMSSMRKMSLADCDQCAIDMNDICNFLHGDHMGSQGVMEEFLGKQVPELADDLFSTHVNILKLKEMLIERDNEITELKNQIENLKLQKENSKFNCKEVITSVKQNLDIDCIETQKINESKIA